MGHNRKSWNRPIFTWSIDFWITYPSNSMWKGKYYQQMMLNHLDKYMEKMSPHPLLASHTEVILRWIIHVGAKGIALLGENTRMVSWVWRGKVSLNRRQKKTITKGKKKVKFGFSKNENFWSSKDVIRKLKKAKYPLGGNICNSHVCQRTYLYPESMKKPHKSLIKRQRTIK